MTISATTQGLRPGVCTSTSRPSVPFDGQVIYETDTNTLAVYDGSGWVSLNPVDRDRNVVINGAMQINQRGTSVASVTTSDYRTADRWRFNPSNTGTWTVSTENDAPTGSGFQKSLKVLCTTADTTPDFLRLQQDIEGQNLQKFKKGTSSAERFTLSFWVKSNVTGTYVVELYDGDNTRQVSASYTVSASATWEKKTLTFPADTTGAFDNDANSSLTFAFGLGFSSTYTSGTLNTSWAASTNANRYVGQVNVAAATNNYWQVTGVQLEVGAVATPFEFEDYGTTLAKCQRYYQQSYNSTVAPGTGTNVGSVVYDNVGGATRVSVPFAVNMRTTPSSVTFYNPTTGTAGQTRNISAGTNINTSAALDPGETRFGFDSGVIASGAVGIFHWTASAEL